MKTLFRICLVCFVLVVIILGAGYLVLTNAGFQKRMLEGKLPEGSSVKHVHVTTGTLELSELILVLPDGTRVKIEEIDTSFSPLAALFDDTIRIGALEVDGLMVQLPAAQATTVDSTGGTSTGSSSSGGNQPVASKEPRSTQPPQNPWESINAISNLQWLLDVETIQLNGKIKDATGTTYAFDIKSGAIRPSAETVVDATLQLVSSDPTLSGLKEFDSKAELRFTQKAHGGFEQIHLESKTSGKDASGSEILSVSSEVDLAFDGFEETATLKVDFNADVQRPELFVPKMASMGALKLNGSVQAKVDGVVMMLSDAGIQLSANGAEVVTLDLKKALSLGGKQNLSGELLEIRLVQLPLTWIGPWLPQGMSLTGAPLSAQINMQGLADGAMEVTSLAPLRIGPISVKKAELYFLEEATIVIDPIIRVNADRSISYELKTFQLLDRYGEVMNGQVSGKVKQVEMGDNPFAGQQADVKLNIGLQELFQQPLLKDKASILGGTLALSLKVDGEDEYSLTAQGAIHGLRPRSEPGSIKDYRFATQLKAIQPDVWGLGLNFESGSADRPNTSLQVSGQANATATPLTFEVDVKGAQIHQADLDVLAAAFTPNDSTTRTSPTLSTSTQSTSRPSVASSSSVPASSHTPPPWSALDGKATIQLDRVLLASGQIIRNVGAQALISQPLLQVSGVTAQLSEGSLSGAGEVRYQDSSVNAYSLLADFGFQKIDPAFFSKKHSGSFPVTGLFDGQFKFTGAGPSLEEAGENSVGDLTITGREGVVTAFELDNRSQLGLGIVGILGQQFDRPGVAALAETVPYFKDIRFDNFTLKMTRGADRKVMVPQLRFEGRSLLIDGSGFIAASSFKEILNQPLQLGLELGAKGRLTNYLETLQLLQLAVSEDGFRRWTKSVNITGTLGEPNAEEILSLLKSAARTALDKPKKASAPVVQEPAANAQNASPTQEPLAEEPRERTKEEKLRDDIDVGLDLFNSVFGD
ncbi:MAG: hypothetical protein ACN4GF_08115 [Lentimonas sp.]